MDFHKPDHVFGRAQAEAVLQEPALLQGLSNQDRATLNIPGRTGR